MSAIIPTVVLSNVTKIPVLGLASWGWNDAPPGTVTQAVKDAIDLGYRHIDTTPGKNEEEVGVAIFDKIKEGVVKREELYLVGKLGDTKTFHKPELIKDSLLSTLRNLNVAYIDLYVINCPEDNLLFAGDDFVDTWYEMEKLVDNFLVKSIGASNFNDQQITHVLNSARFSPVTNQLECNPNYTQKVTRDFCRQKRIAVTAYNIYGSPSLIQDPMIVDLAKKYKKTPEQILLRYQLDMEHIAVPQTQSKADLQNNLDVLKFELSKSDLTSMEKLDHRNKQYI